MRGLSWWITFVLLSCGRSGVELGGDGGDESSAQGGSGPFGDDDIMGGTAGSTSTGGSIAQGGLGGTSGGAPGGRAGGPTAGAGGSGGRPDPTIDPGGPIPNCGSDSPTFVPLRESRWLALDARSNLAVPATRYLVEITPQGPGNLTTVAEIADDSELGGWSADGRFFAFTRMQGDVPLSVQVLEVSHGAPPVPVSVPERPGIVSWSPVGARYYLVPEPASDSAPRLLTVVELPTGAERVIEIPDAYESATWSSDGRYIAFAGEAGVTLVDTSGSDLTLDVVFDEQVYRDPAWSPDGRYLAFASEYVNVYDTQELTLNEAELDRVHSQGWDLTWFRNDWLVWKSLNSFTFFLDVSQTPFAPVELEGQRYPGVPSPSGKCTAYRGDCPTPSLGGLCVRSLPPSPETHPIVIGYETDGDQFWAGNGEHLLVAPFDPWLLHLELDGGDFTRRRFTDGTDTDRVGLAAWNPGGRADWIFYAASPLAHRFLDARFWHRETNRTLSIDLVGGHVDGATWSPDGRYLIIASNMGFEIPDVLVVQEVYDRELGPNFTIYDDTSALASYEWDFEWQP